MLAHIGTHSFLDELLSPGSGTNSFKAGPGAIASGDGSVSIGNLASSQVPGGVAIGPNSDSGSGLGNGNCAVGSSASALGNVGGTAGVASAFGESAAANGAQSGAFASGAIAGAEFSLAMGRQANVGASADGGIAVGTGTSVTHTLAAVIGRFAASTAANRFTVGTIGGANDMEMQCGLGLGVFGVTPPASQPAHIADPTDLPTTLTAVASILSALEGTGIVASV